MGIHVQLIEEQQTAKKEEKEKKKEEAKEHKPPVTEKEKVKEKEKEKVAEKKKKRKLLFSVGVNYLNKCIKISIKKPQCLKNY